MKLNDLKCVGYFEDGGRYLFELDCGWSEASALDGRTLTVTQDGDTVEQFFGYKLDEIKRDAETLFVWFRRALDDASAAAIESLEESVNALHTSVTEANTTAASAKQAAAEAGTDPAVAAAAKMFVASSASMTSSEVGSVLDLIADFEPGAEYAKGQVRRHDGKYWRMAKDIDATTSQTYQPGAGTESLYTLIDLAPDGVRVWHAVTGSTDSFELGERCHYPDADGPVYVSKRNGNDSEPGTDEWWELGGDE